MPRRQVPLHGRVVRAGMRLIEIRFAVFTAHDGLAIDHDRAHRKGVQRLNDARVAVHPIEAAASVAPYPIVAAPGDQAVSVVLDLVHPLRPALASVGCGRKARCDESPAAEDAGKGGENSYAAL